MWKLADNSTNAKEELRVTFRETLEDMMKEDSRVVVLEADLGGASGFAKIKKKYPDQFIEMGIAEANMVGVAAGLSMRGFIPFLHTFAPFASRRIADQVFLEGAYARNTMNIYGSDPGICAAANGGTHTTFEDIAFYRAVPEVMVFAPADTVQLDWLVRELKDQKGVHYIRANRKSVRRIYETGSAFKIGKGNIIKKGEEILLISMGEMLSEALEAANELEIAGIRTEVIDMFTIKPLDTELILAEAEGKRKIITFENHNIINGLGSAVAEVLAENGCGIPLIRIGVQDQFGQVGSYAYLKEKFGLTKEAIIQAVLKENM